MFLVQDRTHLDERDDILKSAQNPILFLSWFHAGLWLHRCSRNRLDKTDNEDQGMEKSISDKKQCPVIVMVALYLIV